MLENAKLVICCVAHVGDNYKIITNSFSKSAFLFFLSFFNLRVYRVRPLIFTLNSLYLLTKAKNTIILGHKKFLTISSL